jgi:WD40 repeat protein
MILTNAAPFSSVAFSPDGNSVITAGDHAQLWEAATGREIFTFRAQTRSVRRVAFSPDGSRLATASHDGRVRIWNAAEAEELPSVRVSEDVARFGIFTRNGSLIALIGSDHVTICDSRSGRTVQTIRDLPGSLAG